MKLSTKEYYYVASITIFNKNKAMVLLNYPVFSTTETNFLSFINNIKYSVLNNSLFTKFDENVCFANCMKIEKISEGEYKTVVSFSFNFDKNSIKDCYRIIKNDSLL